MAYVVPSDHPDGGEWKVYPVNGGGYHGVHSVTLDNTTTVDQAEMEATIAINEARYTGKEPATPDEPDVDES
jgi:hypothetical protein